MQLPQDQHQTPINQAIANRVRLLRQLKKITQEQMAEELGISQQAYSNLEAGKVILNEDKLKKVALILGESVESLRNAALLHTKIVEKDKIFDPKTYKLTSLPDVYHDMMHALYKQNMDLQVELHYWKQRCEQAEQQVVDSKKFLKS
jgi:transcriptional regulator with XRE-family HTH domain